MNSYIKKIKIYVVGTIIIIFTISGFVALGINKNVHFSPNYLVRQIKAINFRSEFKAIPLLASSIDPNLLDLDYSSSIPVVVYHGIPYSDIPNQYSITLENFKDQMFYLKKAGYNTITTQDLYKYLRKEITLPPKSILITFDDGRVDSFELADPIFKALDFKATMFVIGRYSLLGERGKYYLSPSQLKEMESSGRWDIEAHSYDGHGTYLITPNLQDGHFFSHKQWIDSENRLETDQEFTDRVKGDMEKVKFGLENLLGKTIQSFAYPYGNFGQNNTNFNGAVDINTEESKKMFSMEFYQNAPSQRFKNNYLIDENSGNNFFLIKRIDINSQWKGVDLLSVLEKSTSKNLPYNDSFTQDNGWLTLWGKMTIGNGSLTLNAQEGQTGGTALLDGTRLWSDYSIKASAISPNMNGVYIWARFQDDENNAACNFGNGFIHIEQTVNGIKNTIQGKIDKSLTMTNKEIKVEAKVKGREIECILNSTTSVKSSFLDPKLYNGGVGFKTWGAEPSTASLIIKNLEINAI